VTIQLRLELARRDGAPADDAAVMRVLSRVTDSVAVALEHDGYAVKANPGESTEPRTRAS